MCQIFSIPKYKWLSQPYAVRVWFSKSSAHAFIVVRAVDLPMERICGFRSHNLSGEMLGGLSEEYLRSVHEHRLCILHQAGTRCAVHLDGSVKGLLDKVVEAGFDAVEALTPLPGGDVSFCP